MKVVLLTSSFNVGGTERQIILLARGLKAMGDEVSVALYYSGGILEPELHASNIPVYCANKKGRWDSILFFSRLWRYFRKERPDIIYSYLPGPNLILLILRFFLPRQIIVLGLRASYVDFRKYHWLEGVSFRLSGLLSSRANLIIANSQSGAEYHIQRGYSASKISVVPNGVNTELFSFSPQARKSMRTRWNVHNDLPVVGMVGRFDPLKDHETFLKACQLVSQKNLPVRFAIIGDGSVERKSYLQNLGSRLNLGPHIIWEATTLTPQDIYSALDLFVLPSIGEGFSNVLVEAMACELPCLATDIGDARFILGENQAFLASRDPTFLAQRIIEAISAGIPARAGHNRERVIQKFSCTKMVASTRALLVTCVRPE